MFGMTKKKYEAPVLRKAGKLSSVVAGPPLPIPQ
jgi:hypothetical protein